jgi:hypothetical protein
VQIKLVNNTLCGVLQERGIGKLAGKIFYFHDELAIKKLLQRMKRSFIFTIYLLNVFSQITTLIAFSKRERRDIRDRFTKIHFDRLSPKNSSLFKIGNFKNTFALL